jgi:hypothetical protein
VGVEALAPPAQAKQAVLHKTSTCTLTLLDRRRASVEVQGSTWMADNDADSTDARTLKLLPAPPSDTTHDEVDSP